MLVDTHCHLDFPNFEGEQDFLIDRAERMGVGRFVNPGINLPSSVNTIQLSEKHPGLYPAVGVHPSEVNNWGNSTYSQLKDLAKHKKVVAIGEIGLDYYRDKSNIELQKAVFKSQLELAIELDLPVIIHIRNDDSDTAAMKDSIEIIDEYNNLFQYSTSKSLNGVFHSFSNNLDYANKVILMGFYIGISGPVTYKNAQELQSLVIQIDLNNLLIETDSPFLPPHPYRGKRNEPANVKIVAEKIASLKNLSYEYVAETTTINARRLFKW